MATAKIPLDLRVIILSVTCPEYSGVEGFCGICGKPNSTFSRRSKRSKTHIKQMDLAALVKAYLTKS